MPGGRMHTVVRRLRQSALLDAGLSDGALLERYLAQRDDAAFTALVRRHGPMVLGVCRRVLRDAHDADDAFQATFLVLVRKAQTIFPRGRVGPWLYGVAYRTSMKAKAMSSRRRAKEKVLQDLPSPPQSPDADWLALLDREIQRLPDKYRLPVVLCDLESKTRKQAARQLGWPEGTVATRLQHGRALVQKRLLRHGLPCSAGAITLAWAEATSAASVPASLASATIQTASVFAAGKFAGLVPLKIIALAQGVLQAMVLTKIKNASAMVLLLGVLGLTLGGLAGGSRSAASDESAAEKTKAANRQTLPASQADSQFAVGFLDGGTIERSEGRLPTGPAPMQALVSLDKNKIVVRTNQPYYEPRSVADPTGRKVSTYYELRHTLRADRYDRDQVEVYDTQRRKLDNKDMAKWLKEEIPALVLMGSRDIDPLHLRLIKDGTLIFVLPVQPAPAVAVVPVLADGTPNPAAYGQPALTVPPRAPTLRQAAPVDSDAIVVHQRKVSIPIHIDEKRRGDLREILLYSSTDRGRTWQQVVSIMPKLRAITLDTPADGTYWLRVVVVDRAGKQEPADVAKGPPDLKIVIDTRNLPPPVVVPPATPVTSYPPAPSAPLPPPTLPTDGRIDQAERDLVIAEFYLKSGHRGSAIFYYELIQRRYAGTSYAHRAAELLRDLRTQEQPQRPAEKAPERIGQIIITGNKRVPDFTILEALGLYPGQILDFKQIRAAAEKAGTSKELANVSPIIEIRPTITILEPQGHGPYRDLVVTVNESLRLDVLAEMEKLDGTWTVTAASADGKELPHMRDGELIFQGDRLTAKLNKTGNGSRSSITLDPSANPKSIRLTPLDRPADAGYSVGTYVLTGDTLKLSLRSVSGSTSGSGTSAHPMIFTLKRKRVEERTAVPDAMVRSADGRIRIESKSKQWTIIAATMSFEADGRVTLTDAEIVRHASDQNAHVMRGKRMLLTFDGPVRSLADFGPRQIVSIQADGVEGFTATTN